MTAHPIPLEALDGDIAILGRKGGGKSYTAKGIVERLLDLKRRVLILDPLGVWAGLRTGADGKTDGYPIAIFGGEHADLPLDIAAAEQMAKIIARENLPAVIDLSDLSKMKQQGFLLKFLHVLRSVNREALTLVLEEADVFAPQSPQGDDSKQLHGEIDWIARRGRFRGFRLITITQRPARLSKDVLTQANCLIMHRLPAPQDRDAARAWVDGNGDRDQSKVVFDTLSGLKVGEAWILAQEPLMLERSQFPIIKTLDTSATPKAGEKRITPKTLAQVDVSSIRQALEASQKKPAPVAAKSAPQASLADLQAAEQRGYDRGLVEGIERGKQTGIALGLTRAHQAVNALRVPEIAASAPVQPVRPAAALPRATKPTQAPVLATGEFSGPQIKVLRSLSMWRALGHEHPTKVMVAVVAGYSAKSGGFGNLLGQLRVSGAVEYPQPGHISLLADPVPMTVEEGRDLFLGTLSGPQRKLFDVLLNGPLPKVELGEATGYSPSSGGFGNLLGQLRSMGVAQYPAPGHVELCPWVFEVMSIG